MVKQVPDQWRSTARASGSGTDGLDGNFRDVGLVAGDICVAGIGGSDGGEPCDMKKWAQGLEAGEDDIMGGKLEREPLPRAHAKNCLSMHCSSRSEKSGPM